MFYRPSFRDEEVNWEYVRVLPDGEAVSVDGTHLGEFGASAVTLNHNRICLSHFRT